MNQTRVNIKINSVYQVMGVGGWKKGWKLFEEGCKIDFGEKFFFLIKYVKLASLVFKFLLYYTSYVLFYSIITSCIMCKLDILF